MNIIGSNQMYNNQNNTNNTTQEGPTVTPSASSEPVKAVKSD